MSGVGINKVFLLFKHLGLCSVTTRTYFIHQKELLIPSAMVYWEKYRNSLIDKVKKIKNATWSGDGRFDSMGHSAKYGAYTMFCNSISKIVHFEIRQVIIMCSIILNIVTRQSYQNWICMPKIGFHAPRQGAEHRDFELRLQLYKY